MTEDRTWYGIPYGTHISILSKHFGAVGKDEVEREASSMQTAAQTQAEGETYQEPAPLPSLAPGTKVQYRPYHGWDAPHPEPYRIYATTVTETEDGAGGVTYVLVPWDTPPGTWQGRRIAPVDAQQVRLWPTPP